MTEREQLEAMLERAGVPFEKKNEGLALCVVRRAGDQSRDPLIGYDNFQAELTFDAEGRLVQIGIWE